MNFSKYLSTFFFVTSSVFAAYESFPVSTDKIVSSSDHFEIRISQYKYGSNIEANTVSESEAKSLAGNALQTLESVFATYHTNLKFPEPSLNGKKYKTRVYIYPEGNLDVLYGGSADGLPTIWVGVKSLSDPWGMAHEYTHGLQANVGGIGNNVHAGWIYEGHANWMAHQQFRDNAHCSEMLVNFPYLYYGSTRDRYCNWQYFEYFKDNHGGAEAFNKIWSKSKRGDDQIYQTPFTAIQYIYNWDLETLNKDFGTWATKNVTWDYSNGTVYRNAYGDYELSTRRDSWRPERHGRVTMLNALDENNRYISPSYWAPQRYGYNIVRIYPDKSGDSKITLKFRGIIQKKNEVANSYTCLSGSDFGAEDWYKGKKYVWCNLQPQNGSPDNEIKEPGSNWSWALVAVNADGTPRYSELQYGTGKDMTFDVKSNDKALYLVVTATPSVEQTILWDQFYYTIYRYPYMIELEGAKPEGFQNNAWIPARTTNYIKHPNGGGYVSKSASVASTVYVGPSAVVNGGTITGDVRIEDFAVVNGGTISGNAIVRGRALVSGGTLGGSAILEEDAWLISGSVTDNAQIGALSVIRENTQVSGNAKIYGTMWALTDKKINGTAEFYGDLENNFGITVSSGVYYGFLDDAVMTTNKFAHSTKPAEVTASIDDATWWDISSNSQTTEFSSSSNFTTSSSSKAISSESKQETAIISKHPINKRILVIGKNMILQGKVKIQIFSLQGQHLKTVQGQNVISLEALPAGSYIVKIQNGSNITSRRIDLR